MSRDEEATRELLVELLGVFYGKGWVSGTGGGICGPADGGGLLLAPTGVHKERIRPDEFFTIDPADGRVLASPDDASLRPSECNAIFSIDRSRARAPGASSTRTPCPGPRRRPGADRRRRPRGHPRPRDAQGRPRADQSRHATSCRSSATRPANRS